MHSVHSLLNDVEVKAEKATATILKRAFTTSYLVCPNCSYPPNAEMYALQLSFYTKRQREIHRMQRSLDAHTWYSVSRTNLRNALHRLQETAAYWRTQMDKHEPCQACRQRFNPTGRVKYATTTQPKQKEFLDDCT